MYLQPSPCLSSRTTWLESFETTAMTTRTTGSSSSSTTTTWQQEQQQLLQDFVSGSSSSSNNNNSSSSSIVSAVASIMATKKKQANWEIQVIREQIMSTTETMGQVLRERTKSSRAAAAAAAAAEQQQSKDLTKRHDWEVAHCLAMELDCLEYKLNILIKSYRLQHGEEPPAPHPILFNAFALTMSDIRRYFKLYNKFDLIPKKTEELFSILVQLANGKYFENDDLIVHWQGQSDEWKAKFGGSVPVIKIDFTENRDVLIERIVAYLGLSDE